MTHNDTNDTPDDNNDALRYKHFPRISNDDVSPVNDDFSRVNDEPTLPLTQNEERTAGRDSAAGYTQGNASNSSETKSGNFGGALTVKCPTCQGKGKLTQSQADRMVALIPVRDKRLKPRKTKLYLAITAVISIIVIFLVTFFLLPRSISLTISGIDSMNIFVPPPHVKGTPHIDVDVTFLIDNENFFSANVQHISSDITWNKFLINSTVIHGGEDFEVDGRTKKNHTVKIRQYFMGDANPKVKGVCGFDWKWHLLEMFVSTATVRYSSRTEEISNTHYDYVRCFNDTIY